MAGYNLTRAFLDSISGEFSCFYYQKNKQMTTEFVKNVSRILLAKYQENQMIVVCILI